MMRNELVYNKAAVGILTFHESLNYGANLQAYALRHMISNLAYDAWVINYRCDTLVRREDVVLQFRPKDWFRAAARMRLIQYFRSRSDKIAQFTDFRRRELRMTPPCDRSTIADVCGGFDYVVVGSDQVWNGNLTGNDPTYFLDFIVDDHKKKSYAVSIGNPTLPENGLNYPKLLKGFSSIMLREETAVSCVKRFLPEGDFKVVLDPTLLLEVETWNKISALPSELEGIDYIVMFPTKLDERMVLAARKLASECKCELVHIKAFHGDTAPSPAEHVFNAISPYEFVGTFRSARAAVLSRFHGVCFAIIHNIDFYYQQSDASSTRISDLLALLNIHHRSVDDYLANTQEPIPWNSVNARLSILREQSITLLNNSLS